MARVLPILTDTLTAVLGPAPMLGARTSLGWALAILHWASLLVRNIVAGKNGLP
jgi:hypothetical protein